MFQSVELTLPAHRLAARASVNTMREVIKGVLETELQGCTYHVRHAPLREQAKLNLHLKHAGPVSHLSARQDQLRMGARERERETKSESD